MKPFLLACALAFATMTWADEFDIMRQRLLNQVALGTRFDTGDEDIKAYVSAMDKQMLNYWSSMEKEPATKKYLWKSYNKLTDDDTYSSAHVWHSYGNLREMAKCYACPASAYYHNADLLADIKLGLDYLNSVAFNATTDPIGNFYEWRIGTPEYYGHIVTMLYDELSDEQKANYDAAVGHMVRDLAVKGNMTYANQANVCQELITLGILSKKGEDIQSALTNSVRVFVDATTVTQRNKAQTQFEKCWKAQGDYHDFGGVGSKKEGYWPDGTFIQHICIPYIGGYGMEMIEESSFMARILSGTSFAVPDAIIQALPALIEKTYLPAIYKGEMMLMFMGRSTTVNPFQNASHILLDCYISAKEYISDAATRRRIITACKNSILLPAYSVGFSGMSPMRDKIRYEELLAENTDDVTQSEAFSLFYPCGDRLIHQTAKYRFGLSMSSARIGKFESINSMNTNGWYTGDGMTYLYLPTDRNQYVGYFNNVNWYRLPGTTVDATNRKPESGNYGLFGIPKNQKDWVGGLHFRNRYAQAGMYLQSQISSLNARKSWFCFTDEIVCLGAGITMTEQHKAETVIENRKSGQTLNVDGQVQEKKKGAEMTHANPTYMHLEGTGGYWFPEANQSVNSYLSYDGYMMCYFNHGVAPANARYAYVLLPGMSREETEAYAAKPAITVLNNDTIVQAVLHGKDKVVGINFWQAASYIGIQSDGPASVMLQQEDEYLFIAISEPTWKRDALTLTLDGEFRLRQSSVENIVSVQSNGKKTTVTVNTKDRWGQAVELQMKGVLNIPAEPDEEDLAEQTFPFRPETEKLMRDGQLVIRTGNRLFNALGQHIE